VFGSLFEIEVEELFVLFEDADVAKDFDGEEPILLIGITCQK
jgi:hypothetical protein